MMTRYSKLLFLLSTVWMLYSSAQAAEAPEFDHDMALATSQGAIGSTLSNVLLVNVDGNRIDLDSLLGKPLVISLIYTSCHHICPATTQHLKKVVANANDALGDGSFNVLTIGFDVFRDNPAMMRTFARAQGVDEDNWFFLSSDERTIKQLTGELGFLFYEAPHGFDHLIQATLLTKDREVYRQIYGINFEMPLLMEPLKELVLDQPTESVFMALANKVRLFCTVYDPSQDKYRYDYSLFIGMFIGFCCVGFLGLQLVKEWRRTLVQRS
jgi:protein SCO1/2